MRTLASLVCALGLIACQRAESSKPAPAPATASAPAPGAMTAPSAPIAEEEHACNDMDEDHDEGGEMAAPHGPVALPAGTEWTALKVSGMHCGKCAAKIEAALAKVDGVAAVDIDLPSKTVKVAALPGKDVRALASGPIDALGYHVE
jgi:copper chaperone CopZ